MNHGIHGTHGNLLLAEETYAVRGAAFEVYKAMGAGFLEAVYQESLGLEFTAAGIPFRAAPQLRLSYKGTPLRQGYSPDFICFEQLIVELKAVREIAPEHRAGCCLILEHREGCRLSASRSEPLPCVPCLPWFFGIR
jgi:GxxExxY protein